MLLMIKKGIRSGIYLAIHSYANGNITYVKDYDPTTESSHTSCTGISLICMYVQCYKSCLQMVLSGKRTNLNSLRNSCNITMMAATTDTSLRLMLYS